MYHQSCTFYQSRYNVPTSLYVFTRADIMYQQACTFLPEQIYCTSRAVSSTRADIMYQQACKLLPEQIQCTSRPVSFYQNRYNVPAGHSCHQVWNIWALIKVAVPLWALHLTFFSLQFSASEAICCDENTSSYLSNYQAVSLKKPVDMHVGLYVQHSLFCLILTKTDII